MKQINKYLLAVWMLLCCTTAAKAQIAFTGGTYTQNFNTYQGSLVTLPAGWSTSGSFTFRGTGNGTSNTGGGWAYGTGTDWSLGYLGSGTSSSIVYAVSFVNNTGSAITNLNISYDYEQWRFAGGNTNGWTVTGSGALAAVSLSGLNTNSTGAGTSGIVSVTPKSISLTGLNIAPGAAFGIRWACSDGSGNDNGNGIDNFQLVRPCSPSPPLTVDTMLCAGGSYTWNGNTYTTPQNITHTFANVGGCDSVVTLDLGFYPQITHSFADTICFNANYTWGAQTLTATGIYTQVFTSALGCDSTVTLGLWERPEITYNFSDTICFNDMYTWGVQTLNATGIYTQTFPAVISGCDSTVTLSLFERNAITHSFADTICWGESYLWESQALTATGAYTQVFSAVSGCDSTVTLNLFERPAITHSFADTICWNASYVWGTQTLTATGVYTQVFPSAVSGCDSTVTLNLFERPAITHSFADTICWNASYVWGVQTLTATGVYTQVFPSVVSGCDSTVTLNLFERPAITHSFSDTICWNASYVWGVQTLTATGVYTQVFPSVVSSCDSTVTLNLYVAPVSTTNLTATICSGTSYTLGSQVFTASGVYTVTFTSVLGCDSLVVLNLTVAPAITNTVSTAICNGTVYNWGSQVLSASGSYVQTFAGLGGCDSIVTLNLTVNPPITHTVSAVVCNGGSYIFGTQLLNAGGTYNQVFPAANGCDSSVTLNLSISPVAIAQITDTAACGVVLFEGNSYFSTATLQDTLGNSHGCDSIYRTIHIAVYNNTAAQLTIDTSGCGSVLFEGNTYLQNATLHHMYTGIHGCDSLERTVNIRIEQKQSDTVRVDLCAGAGYDFHGTRYTSSGTYTASYTGMHGCDSGFVLLLSVHPLPEAVIEIPAKTSFCVGDSVKLAAVGPYSYRWTDEWDIDLGEGEEKNVLLPAYTSLFTAEATDANGCRDTASVAITAQPCCTVWLPNAFSPNGDGLNDKFKPEANGHPKEYVLYIFDRWGTQVFSSFNITEGWDGTINGKQADIATYYYRISGKCVNGEPLDKRGELTLIR